MVYFLAETLGCFNPFSQILRFFVASVLYSFASCILDSLNGKETWLCLLNRPNEVIILQVTVMVCVHVRKELNQSLAVETQLVWLEIL